MKVFNKISATTMEMENSVEIDGYFFHKKEMFSREDMQEIAIHLMSMPFLDRKDITWRRENLSHFFKHDLPNIHKFLYLLSQLRDEHGQFLFKLIDDHGYTAIKLEGDFKMFIERNV